MEDTWSFKDFLKYDKFEKYDYDTGKTLIPGPTSLEKIRSMQYFVACQNMGRNNEEGIDFTFEKAGNNGEKLNPDKKLQCNVLFLSLVIVSVFFCFFGWFYTTELQYLTTKQRDITFRFPMMHIQSLGNPFNMSWDYIPYANISSSCNLEGQPGSPTKQSNLMKIVLNVF